MAGFSPCFRFRQLTEEITAFLRPPARDFACKDNQTGATKLTRKLRVSPFFTTSSCVQNGTVVVLGPTVRNPVASEG